MRLRWPLPGLVLAMGLPAFGQADWSRVKALDPGTEIRVKSLRGPRMACDVVRVDEDGIVCSRTRTVFFFPVTRQMVFPRARVREVRLTRAGLSTLVGGAIGVGAGVGIGYGLQNRATKAEDPGLLPAVIGILAGAVGAGVGHGTDFLGGPTVYRVP